MSIQRIPVMFPDSFRSQGFFVKISSEASLRAEKRSLQCGEPAVDSAESGAAQKTSGGQGVPSSPLND